MPKKETLCVYIKNKVRFQARIIINSFFTYIKVLSTDWGVGEGVCRTILVVGDWLSHTPNASSTPANHYENWKPRNFPKSCLGTKPPIPVENHGHTAKASSMFLELMTFNHQASERFLFKVLLMWLHYAQIPRIPTKSTTYWTDRQESFPPRRRRTWGVRIFERGYDRFHIALW